MSDKKQVTPAKTVEDRPKTERPPRPEVKIADLDPVKDPKGGRRRSRQGGN